MMKVITPQKTQATRDGDDLGEEQGRVAVEQAVLASRVDGGGGEDARSRWRPRCRRRRAPPRRRARRRPAAARAAGWRSSRSTPPPRPIRIAEVGVTKPAAGVIATRPATAPAAAPSTLGWPLCAQAHGHPGQRAHRSRRVGRHEGVARQAVRGQRAARVEAEPAEPEQARAQHRHRQVVRLHLLLAQADPVAEHRRRDQRRDAGGDVHDGAAREVERAELAQPAARRPRPSARADRRRRSPRAG